MPDPAPTAHESSPAKDTDGADMSRILVNGTLWGLPVWFVIATMIARVVGVSWAGATIIGAWGALVGGPFFGAMLFFGKQVGDLSH